MGQVVENREKGSKHVSVAKFKCPNTGAQVIIKVTGHQYQWLRGGYDLEIGHF